MTEYNIGDLVWAKMQGFPPWPGRISEPPKNLQEAMTPKKNSVYHCIYFFGSHNYSWIETDKLKPYLKHKDEFKNSGKSVKFVKACKEITEFLEENNLSSDSVEDKFDKLLDSSNNEEKAVKSPAELLAQRQIAIPQKRASSQKKLTVKKKKSNYSAADTTTVDSNVCDPTFDDDEESANKIKDSVYKHENECSENENESPDNTETSNDPCDLSSQDELNPCNFTIGFVGLGNMGKALVKRLLRTGHALVLWNRSPEKINEFRNVGVKVASTAGEVVDEADITFICVSDAVASKDIMFGNDGAMSYLGPGKSYVDITSTDVETSLDLSEAVFSTGARYLEVRLQGSIREANEGSLICLAAGEQSLYNDCSSIFKACCKKSLFLGEVGNATKIHLTIQLLIGVNLAGLAESLALADRAGLDQKELLTILERSQLSSPLLLDKAKAMLDGDWVTKSSLRNLQTNVKYALLMGEGHDLPSPMGASVNELYKHAKNLGYGEHDVSAIFIGARF